MVGRVAQRARKRQEQDRPLRVWLGHVDTWDEDAAIRVLSPEEQGRRTRLRFAKDRRRFAVSHAALRYVLAGLLDIAPEAVVVQAGQCVHCGEPHGKPAAPATGLGFNLTHSGQLFGIVVHRRREVGIDIQQITSTPSVDLARRFFVASEHAALRDLPASDRPAAFAHMWSRKEAVLKASGDGIFGGLSSFAVPGRGQTEVRGPRGDLYAVTDLHVPDGYAGAVAAAGAGMEVTFDDVAFRQPH